MLDKAGGIGWGVSGVLAQGLRSLLHYLLKARDSEESENALSLTLNLVFHVHFERLCVEVGTLSIFTNSLLT